MSEAIQTEQPPYPGEAWTEIVRRPTLEEFSRALVSDVVLEASVVSRPIVGPTGLWAFFPANRALAPPSLHGTTTGRSRACDYIIAPSIRSLPLLRRFRGISAEARPQSLFARRVKGFEPHSRSNR